MKRHADARLKSWLESEHRKPLVIRGARQVGKSTLVRLFARDRGLTLHEVDLERNPQLADVFASRDPERILREIEFLVGKGQVARPGALLFLDEIQAVPGAIAALRDFREERPELPVIAAGSLLEIALAAGGFSMPVGRIEYLYLEPMSFEEFLAAAEQDDLLELLRVFRLAEPFPDTAHARLLDQLRDYLLVGGMPEAVLRFVESQELSAVPEIHASILETYRDDFAKYATRTEVGRLRKVFDFVPRAVGEKIKYVRIDEGAQSRDLKRAIELLSQARVMRRAFHTDSTGLPLSATIHEHVYKPYFLDVGLVSAACGIRWLPVEELRARRFVNEGKLAEQFVAQHLPLLGESYRDWRLTYWLREGRASNAEIDFLIQLGASVVPVEVKAGKSGSLKSLLQFVHQRGTEKAVRFDLNPPGQQAVSHTLTVGGGTTVGFQLLSLPLYLVEQLPRLWEEGRG